MIHTFILHSIHKVTLSNVCSNTTYISVWIKRIIWCMQYFYFKILLYSKIKSLRQKLKAYSHSCSPLLCPVRSYVFYIIGSFELSYVSYHSRSCTSMCERIIPWHTFFLLRLAVLAPRVTATSKSGISGPLTTGN